MSRHTSSLHERKRWYAKVEDSRDQVIAKTCPDCPTVHLQFDQHGAYCPRRGREFPAARSDFE